MDEPKDLSATYAIVNDGLHSMPDEEKRFLMKAADEADWDVQGANGDHRPSLEGANQKRNYLAWIYFQACARQNHLTAVALAKEAGEKFGVTPIEPHLKPAEDVGTMYAVVAHYVADQFPGLLGAMWANIDIIGHLDNAAPLRTFCDEVAALMGKQLIITDEEGRTIRDVT